MALSERASPELAPPGRQLWFLDTRVTVHVSFEDGTNGISVLEHWAPEGDSPPLHVHLREDEIFHVLEGRLRLRVGEEDFAASAGESRIVPRGVPHTYRVESADGARWLTITAGKDFERMVRAFSWPAEREGLPERAGAPPSPRDAEQLAAACREYGIELVGPPLS